MPQTHELVYHLIPSLIIIIGSIVIMVITRLRIMANCVERKHSVTAIMARLCSHIGVSVVKMGFGL